MAKKVTEFARRNANACVIGIVFVLSVLAVVRDKVTTEIAIAVALSALTAVQRARAMMGEDG